MSKTLILAAKCQKGELMSEIKLQAAAHQAVLHADNVKYLLKRAEWLDTAFLTEQMAVTAYADAYVRFIENQKLFIGDEKTWWIADKNGNERA